MDLITKDLNKANKEINFWKKAQGTEIIFSCNDNEIDIGWYLSDKKIYRIEGTFNSNIWSKKDESLVCENIEKLDFQFNQTKLTENSNHNNNQINLIYVSIVGKVNNDVVALEKSISLKNGNI